MTVSQIIPVSLLKLSFVLAAFLLGSSVFAQDERGITIEPRPSTGMARVALVIGNSRYDDAPLKNPANDAEDIADVLQQLDFEVTLLTDADLPSMSQAVSEFGESLLDDSGVAVFYFAGHGMQVSGRNFLIPVSANIGGEDEIPYKSIDANLVLAKMESAGSKTNILILDACRNNPFARSFRSGTRGLAQMDAPKGTLIVYATAPGDVAFDGDGRNGLFTENLLQNIGTPDLDVELMFRKVRVGVLAQSGGKQTPWTASSLQGNFTFNGAATPMAQSQSAGSRVAMIKPRRSWRRDLPEGADLEEVRSGNALSFIITAEGKSTGGDAVTRRIQGKKDAMRKVSSVLRAKLEFHDLKLSRSRLAVLEKNGELVDLVYLDDERVQVSFEVPIPADLAKSIPAE